MASKVKEISELIINRINSGDYAFTPLPTGRKLAEDVGVSYVTARRAIQQVVDEGWLRRTEEGKLELGKKPSLMSGLRIAFVCPAFASGAYFEWLRSLQGIVKQRGGLVRFVAYSHWDDRVISDVLDGDFDGVFMIPPVDMPKIMEDKLSGYRHKLVTMFHDITDRGIPFIDGQPASAIDVMINKLADMGHKRVDCLNTQPDTQSIENRIHQWSESLANYGLTGKLHNSPVQPYENPGHSARALMTHMLERTSFDATAVFCPTVSAARGVMRAIKDAGLEPGEDISICSFGEDYEARLLIPTLTVVRTIDPSPYLAAALDWIETSGENWTRGLAFRPQSQEIYWGESTNKPKNGSSKINRNNREFLSTSIG